MLPLALPGVRGGAVRGVAFIRIRQVPREGRRAQRVPAGRNLPGVMLLKTGRCNVGLFVVHVEWLRHHIRVAGRLQRGTRRVVRVGLTCELPGIHGWILRWILPSKLRRIRAGIEVLIRHWLSLVQ